MMSIQHACSGFLALITLSATGGCGSADGAYVLQVSGTLLDAESLQPLVGRTIDAVALRDGVPCEECNVDGLALPVSGNLGEFSLSFYLGSWGSEYLFFIPVHWCSHVADGETVCGVPRRLQIDWPDQMELTVDAGGCTRAIVVDVPNGDESQTHRVVELADPVLVEPCAP